MCYLIRSECLVFLEYQYPKMVQKQRYHFGLILMEDLNNQNFYRYLIYAIKFSNTADLA